MNVRAYYNEHDPGAAAWLRELIRDGWIAPGDVDTRSIVDVRPGDLTGYTQVHFFAGIGGWSYALRLAGWADDRSVWTGSCPCQPFSLAGAQKGFADDRHLWPEFRRLVAERRPAVVFGEQVASASAWLGLVRGDLEAMGYAVGAMPIEAASAGADHKRDRFWFVADDDGDRAVGPQYAGQSDTGVGLADADDAGSQGREVLPERSSERPAWSDGVERRNMANAAHDEPQEPQGDDGEHEQRPTFGRRQFESASAGAGCRVDDGSNAAGDDRRAVAGEDGSDDAFSWVIGADGKARRVKPGIRLLADGFPSRVGLLRGFGNAIDPRPAAAFIKAADEAMRAA